MKKLLKAMITFALMLCILSTGVFAAEDSSNTPKGISFSQTYSDDGIMPLYLYIADFSCGASLDKWVESLVSSGRWGVGNDTWNIAGI